MVGSDAGARERSHGASSGQAVLRDRWVFYTEIAEEEEITETSRGLTLHLREPAGFVAFSSQKTKLPDLRQSAFFSAISGPLRPLR